MKVLNIIIVALLTCVGAFKPQLKPKTTLKTHLLPSFKKLSGVNKNTDPDIERSYEDTFGLLSPLAQVLDDNSGGFALSYANLTGYSATDFKGILFLATNLAYEGAGIFSVVNTNVNANPFGMPLALMLAGAVSTYYHWAQVT